MYYVSSNGIASAVTNPDHHKASHGGACKDEVIQKLCILANALNRMLVLAGGKASINDSIHYEVGNIGGYHSSALDASRNMLHCNIGGGDKHSNNPKRMM